MYYNSVVPQYPQVLLELLSLMFPPPLNVLQVSTTDTEVTHDRDQWVHVPKLAKMTALFITELCKSFCEV